MRIWRDGFSLYKNALSDPNQLMKDLRVEFEGEEGIDAGALKLELLLNEIDNHLFVGLPARRIPKKIGD